MDTMRLMKVLEIVHRHAPDGTDVYASHDQLTICGEQPFTDEERAELEELGALYDESEEYWFCFT